MAESGHVPDAMISYIPEGLKTEEVEVLDKPSRDKTTADEEKELKISRIIVLNSSIRY